MKSSIKILSIALMLFLTNSVFAKNGNPEFTIKDAGVKTLYMEASGLTLNKFELRIEDNKGAVMFSEYVVNPETFKRTYNLSELPTGEYFLFLEDESKTQILTIIIENDEMKIDVENLEIIIKCIVG